MGNWIFEKEGRNKWCQAALAEVFNRKAVVELDPEDEIHFVVNLRSILGISYVPGRSKVSDLYDAMVDNFVKECQCVRDISYDNMVIFYRKQLNDFMTEHIGEMFYSIFNREYNDDLLYTMIELREELANAVFDRQFKEEEYYYDTIRKFIINKYYQESNN